MENDEEYLASLENAFHLESNQSFDVEATKPLSSTAQLALSYDRVQNVSNQSATYTDRNFQLPNDQYAYESVYQRVPATIFDNVQPSVGYHHDWNGYRHDTTFGFESAQPGFDQANGQNVQHHDPTSPARMSRFVHHNPADIGQPVFDQVNGQNVPTHQPTSPARMSRFVHQNPADIGQLGFDQANGQNVPAHQPTPPARMSRFVHQDPGRVKRTRSKVAQPSLVKKKEYGLIQIFISEEDFTTIRPHYRFMSRPNLSTPKDGGRSVRLTLTEFANLQTLRARRNDHVPQSVLFDRPGWLELARERSARYEILLAGWVAEATGADKDAIVAQIRAYRV